MPERLVLLVEDEPLVLLVAQDALEAGGYTVLPVQLASEAMDILDTRIAQKLGANQSMSVAIAGNGPIPNTGVVTVVLNVTVTGPTAGSYLTAWPDGDSRPLASDLNFTAGQTVPNMVVVKVGADGRINLYNAFGSVDVVIDVMGWYS